MKPFQAHESIKAPMEIPPEQPYMHPVDMDTNEPGIVDQKDKLHIHRCSTTLPRVVYCRNGKRKTPSHETVSEPPPAIINVSAEKATEVDRKALMKTIAKAEKRTYEGKERERGKGAVFLESAFDVVSPVGVNLSFETGT